jgi:hypothetical protein
MLKVVLILVYLYLGKDGKASLQTYQANFASVELCQEAGNQLIAEQMKDLRFLGGLYADCVDLNTVQVQEI